MKKTTILSTLLLTMGVSVQAAHETYDWVSSDGDPNHISGTLTLDATSSAGGSVSDIISGSITDANGTFNLTSLANNPLAAPVGGVPPPFTWNASKITSMFFAGSAESGEGLDIMNNLISEIGPPHGAFFDLGSWINVPVDVPDTGSSVWLLGLALAGLGGLRRFRIAAGSL